MLIFDRKQIEEKLNTLNPLPEIEQGFVQFSLGNCVLPPVGELLLSAGEVHIKYGYLKDGDYYIIKVASGFYENPKIGLPSSDGLMQLFSINTGQLKAILLDKGLLTDIRTAVAGAICAKYLAPEQIKEVGIIGTGIQAKLQAEYLKRTLKINNIIVYGRSQDNANNYKNEMKNKGFNVTVVDSIKAICERCRLIVTTTPSKVPLIDAQWVKPGTHITAVGSDTPEKRELSTALLAKAGIVVADSIEQCKLRGEIHHALRSKELSIDNVVELGTIINDHQHLKNDNQISIADLTGLAVQDLMIAKAVLEAH